MYYKSAEARYNILSKRATFSQRKQQPSKGRQRPHKKDHRTKAEITTAYK
ncbi:hypothetical protein Sjap_016020 [Stephania japonica]|uniref:Uncharacterized protein n=1 Tax=Stephania japonica TaxID=461633 RepID=A0AAP0IKC1_9MAGN